MGLAILLIAFEVSFHLASGGKCPRDTIPYPSYRPDNPDSCYLFVPYFRMRKFRLEIWKLYDLSSDGPWDSGGSMNDVVWDIDQARRLCREVHRHPDFAHLGNVSFRLPIIDSSDEDNWLYDQMSTRRYTMGSKFWLDLTYDPFNEIHYWYTTMEEPEVYFNDRGAQEYPEWHREEVIRDDWGGLFQLCFEFHLNDKGFKLRGWHRRACAQAYTKFYNRVTCSWINHVFYAVPWSKEQLESIHAPVSVVCEHSMYQERVKFEPCCNLISTERKKPRRKTKPPLIFKSNQISKHVPTDKSFFIALLLFALMPLN